MTVALSPHLVKKAAYLASTGCSQKRIAALLDTSQATVSRLLAAARRRNWLVTECRLSAEDRHKIARASSDRTAVIDAGSKGHG